LGERQLLLVLREVGKQSGLLQFDPDLPCAPF
jgi:hypothetical protein